jgi:hypothetical protein
MKDENPAGRPADQAGRTPNQDEISRRAHELWQGAGSPENSSSDHWLQAERELTEAAAPAAQSTTPYSASGSSSISGQGAGRS